MAKEAKEKAKKGRGWGITALILGIIYIFLAWIPFLGLILGIIILVISIIGIKKNSGKGMAIAGLILSIVGLIVSLISSLFGGLIIYGVSTGNYTSTSNISIYKIGEEVLIDDITYKVNKLELAEKIGIEQPSGFAGKKTSGIFIILSLDLENKGKETVTLLFNKLKIIDDKEQKFSSDNLAESYYFQIYQKNIISAGLQLQPGLPVSGVKIFELPKEAKNLKLEIGSHKMFSSKLARVDLGR